MWKRSTCCGTIHRVNSGWRVSAAVDGFFRGLENGIHRCLL